MAEAAILATSGWVASPLVKLLIDKALGYLDTNDERREKLAATVIPRLSLVIEKAEQSPNKDKIEKWLRRLKDAYYMAEEVIDDFEYEELKKKVKEARRTQQQKLKNKRGTQISLFPKFTRDKLKHARILSRQQARLRDRIDKLIEIAKEADEFRDLVEKFDEPGAVSHRETHSQRLGRVFGREKDIEKVADLLIKKPSDSEPGPSTRTPIHVIAITGRSGIGKTELAKAVYECMENQKNFDLSVWVHVPRRFMATEVIKDMINNIQAREGDRHVGNHDSSVKISVLEVQIKQLTGSKKVFLVLDDFWCDSEGFGDQWENFISCLGNWFPESRILLTSQFNNVATKTRVDGLSKVETYNLQELKQSPFFELFMHHAWPTDRSDPERESFEEIGQKIAINLKGDPGAAKQVGGELSDQNLSYWKNISEKKWLGDNIKARIWNYQQLPAHLQRCFSFLSLFPKGSKFSSGKLISLWVAEGFVPLQGDEQSMVDTAKSYLQELVSRFFLEEHTYEENNKKYYQLHDLLHDLAERVQGDDFIRIECISSNEIPSPNTSGKNIRHLFLGIPVDSVGMTKELKGVIFSMKNLCTLVIYVEPPGIFPKKVLEEILKNSKKLRYLLLSSYGNDLPENVGDLKHLRFLEISGSSSLKKLPDSICKLFHLELLSLPSCESVPKNFSELISLRWFNLKNEIIPHIPYVGRLTSLRWLSQFVVRTEPGHELHQLEKLNQLRGKMCISGLENVENIEDAAMAKMNEKKYLLEVAFKWNHDGRRASDDFHLLDALQPHPNISILRISGYRGNKFPNWLRGHNSLRHLKSLILKDCDVEEIPSIHESLPNCTILNLSSLSCLIELPVLPPKLTKLGINNIPKLSYFSEDDLLTKDEIKNSVLEVVNQIAEHLKSVDIARLDKLIRSAIIGNIRHMRFASDFELQDNFSVINGDETWSYDNSRDQILDLWVTCTDHHLETMFNKTEKSKLVLPCSLTSLEISNCSITSDALSTCIQLLDSLSELKLCEIQTITSLPSKEVLCALKNLRSLTIQGCFLLNSLGGIVALTSLTELTLQYCINLNVSYEPLPSSLEKLFLVHSTTKIDVGPLSRLKELAIISWDSGHLKGLNLLTELSDLCVFTSSNESRISSPTDKCSSQLEWVSTNNPLLLTKLLSDETFSSLKILSIWDWVQLTNSLVDEVFRSLVSLECLYFHECNNITRLPLSLKDLASLHYMSLQDCPKLALELEDLPGNLEALAIEGCPILTEKFSKDGPYRVKLEEGRTWVTFSTEETRTGLETRLSNFLEEVDQATRDEVQLIQDWLSDFLEEVDQATRDEVQLIQD